MGAVAQEPSRIERKTLHRPFDHGLGCEDLCLPDGGGRLDINDNRIVDIDQIIGRVGKEGLPAVGAGPTRRGICR
jgi:hypothetical protein